MGNYKIRVANEAESKEAEFGLDFLLGGTNICKSYDVYDTYPRFVFGNSEFINTWTMINFDKISNEEITLPQLRDLVVLKRNDAKDCTHWHVTGQANLPYLFAMDEWYFFGRNGWEKSTHNQEFYNRLKPIEQTMKEYLAKDIDGSYKLVMHSFKCCEDWIEVPKGAESFRENLKFYNKDGSKFYSSGNYWANSTSDNGIKILWQRQTQPEGLPCIDDEPSLNDQYAEIEKVREKHSHYKKDVSHLDILDIYRVTELFKPHSCGAHIAKKALCSGERGHKDLLTDIQDIIDTAERWKEMLIEDAK